MMENLPIIVMNFTHVYEEEFITGQKYKWIDCTALNGTDCYCDKDSEIILKDILEDLSPQGIHFIDSGNYHYLTKIWTDKITVPFSLILFDHHPDMQTPVFENVISCGSWVKDMLEKNILLKRVAIIGASDKLKEETKGFGNRVMFFSENYIKNINNWLSLYTFHTDEPVYISIDKDVLNLDYAVTNWDQGSLTLAKMEQLLNVIMSNEKVIGIDVCGELPFFEDDMKNNNVLINEITNMSLLHFINSHIKNNSK